MKFQSLAKKIFGDNIPKESFLFDAHPFTKVLLLVYFCLSAWFSSDFKELCTILIFYFFVITLSKKNPFGPWFIWIWVVTIGYLYYTISAGTTASINLDKVIFYPTKAYLLIAPAIHISKTINTIELVQVIPNRIQVIAIPIMAFSRYLPVSKQQFKSTRDAFHYRGVSINVSFFELFITTVIVNIYRHSEKFADNLEIRNLDSPGHISFAPIYTWIDGVLLGLCCSISIVVILFIN